MSHEHQAQIAADRDTISVLAHEVRSLINVVKGYESAAKTARSVEGQVNINKELSNAWAGYRIPSAGETEADEVESECMHPNYDDDDSCLTKVIAIRDAAKDFSFKELVINKLIEAIDADEDTPKDADEASDENVTVTVIGWSRGCQQGDVHFATYNHQTEPLYEEHRVEIIEMFVQYAEELESTPKYDMGRSGEPLLWTEMDCNYRVWFAIEMIMYDVCTQLGI